MTVKYGNRPFHEAIDYFRNKLNVPTERWNDVWQDAHNSSFMIAGALQNDLLNDFRQAVDRAIAEGKSITWFKSEFQNIVKQHGWSHYGDADWRSRVIYDTNMRQAYNAGRFEQLQHFEYWEYQHGDSRQPRPLHLSWHGLVLPKDDPWWQTHFPTNGWGCKCRVRGRTRQYVERKNIKINKAPNNGSKTWVDKVTGEEHVIPVGIDPGFDYSPRKSEVVKRQKKHAKQKAKVYQAPERLVPSAFSTVAGADVHALNAKLSEFKGGMAERIGQVSAFIQKHNIKSLFLKQAEMGARNAKAKALNDPIADYLGLGSVAQWAYTTARPGRTNGFTLLRFNHVVTKVAASTRFSKAKVADLARAVDDVILLYKDGYKTWSLSHTVRHGSDSGDHGGAIVTWLHELGHQVHIKAGGDSAPVPINTSITEYGSTNGLEWHAEHFAMWVLNREALAKFDEGIAVYFDQLMKKVL